MQKKKEIKNRLLPNDDTDKDDQNENENEEDEIKDKFNLIYVLCLFLGSGTLIGFNFIVSASDHLRIIKNGAIINWFTPIYAISNLLSVLSTIFCGHIFSFTTQIVVCFAIASISIAIVPIFHHSIHDENISFWIVMTSAVLIGATTAILQSAITGFCNYLPTTSYIQIAMSGQAFAGVLAIGIRIITYVLGPDVYHIISDNESGLTYFIVGSLFDFICAAFFLFAVKTSFVKCSLSQYIFRRKYYQNINKKSKQKKFNKKKVIQPIAVSTPELTYTNDNDDYLKSSKSKSKSRINHDDDMKIDDNKYDDEIEITYTTTTHNTSIRQTGSLRTISTISTKHSVNINEAGNDDNNPLLSGNYRRTKKVQNIQKVSFITVLKKIKILAFTIFFTFFVSFVIFPAVFQEIKINTNHMSQDWFIILMIMEYNAGDFIGRQFLSSCTSFRFTNKTIWIASLWRIFFLPIFLLLFYADNDSYFGGVDNAYFAYGANAILSITNGWLCSLCFMWAPSLVKLHEQRVCGVIMSVFLVLGIVFGSYSALGLQYEVWNYFL